MLPLHQTVIDVLKVVTAFTLAHSLTLTLASLSPNSLPSRFVESAIATSVILAACRGRRPVAAFVFGLIHGFGFASVLIDPGLPKTALLASLFGFNLGVELGQCASSHYLSRWHLRCEIPCSIAACSPVVPQ